MEKYKLQKIPRRFELSATEETTVMYLYGYVTSVDYWNDGDVIATADVLAALKKVTTPNLDIHINSFGGSAFDGIAIHNLLKQHSAKVTAYIDGIAASAASIIALGASEVVMPENAMMMIHCASTIAWGNAKELRKEADDLEKIDEAVRTSYMSKFNGTEKQLITLLENETWLTAKDALKVGLCDEILTTEPTPEPAPAPDNMAEVTKALGIKPTNHKLPITLNANKVMAAFLNGLNGE